MDDPDCKGLRCCKISNLWRSLDSPEHRDWPCFETQQKLRHLRGCKTSNLWRLLDSSQDWDWPCLETEQTPQLEARRLPFRHKHYVQHFIMFHNRVERFIVQLPWHKCWWCCQTSNHADSTLLRSWAGSQLPFFFLGITSLYTLEANQLVTMNSGVALSCAVKTSSGVGAFVAHIFLLPWPKKSLEPRNSWGCSTWINLMNISARDTSVGDAARPPTSDADSTLLR